MKKESSIRIGFWVAVLVSLLILDACILEDHNVRFFKNTPAYSLAKAIEKGDTLEISQLVQASPGLLSIIDPITGSDVLSLSLQLENYVAFKKLLALGANPNFINKSTGRSILIDACRFYSKPTDFSINLSFIELLLLKGANPNYAVDESFTNEKGLYQRATSPLYEASKIDLSMVKLLLKYGANPYKRLKQTYASVFYSALNGFQNRIEISNYFIDSLKVDVNDVLAIRHRGEGGVDSIRIQDVILFNDYLKAKITSDSITADNILKSNPDERKENIADWNFVKKLQGMGVDFSHKFKKTETSSQNDRK